MKKKITLNPIIAIVLVLAIAAVSCFSANYIVNKDHKARLTEAFSVEFHAMINGFSHKWETDEEKLRIASDISAHSYSAMSLFPYTSYADNADLSDVVRFMYNLCSMGRVLEAVDRETASELTDLAFRIDDRNLAKNLAEKLSEIASREVGKN